MNKKAIYNDLLELEKSYKIIKEQIELIDDLKEKIKLGAINGEYKKFTSDENDVSKRICKLEEDIELELGLL